MVAPTTPSLVATATAPAEPTAEVESPTQVRLREVALAQLDLRLETLRLFDPPATARLRASIQLEGLHQPVLVSQGVEDGRLVVVDGFKRVRAAKELGLECVMARVVMLDATSSKAALVTANGIRRAPCEIEESLVVQSLHREDGLSQIEIAKLCGRHKSWVCRRLQLIERLSREVQSDLRLGLLSPTAARALAPLPRGNQRQAAQAITVHGLSSRQAVRLAEVLKSCSPAEREAVIADPLRHLQAPQPGQRFPRDPSLDRIGNQIREQLLRLETAANRLVELLRAHPPASFGVSTAAALGRLAVAALPPTRTTLCHLETMTSTATGDDDAA